MSNDKRKPSPPGDRGGSYVIQDLEDREARNRAEALQSFAAMLPKFAQHGIHVAVIEYDGFGDDGCVENITLCGEDGDELTCTELIPKLDEAALELMPYGYADGAGGFGEITITAEGQVKIVHNDRFEDFETSEGEYHVGAEAGQPLTPRGLRHVETGSPRPLVPNVSYPLLAQQKQWLLEHVETCGIEQAMYAAGLVEFLDAVQDAAVASGVPEREVFPPEMYPDMYEDEE